MGLQIAPRHFANRSEFYHQLAVLTSAGVTLSAAVEQLRRSPPSASYRSPLELIQAHLRQGSTFTQAMSALPQWLPAFDLALIEAGELSGRLDVCFRLLAEYYQDRAQLARQVIADLIYPVVLLHFAVLIFSFVSFVSSGNWTGFGLRLLTVLAPAYVLVFLLIYAAQSSHGEKWRALMEAISNAVPVLGGARRYLALARLSAALEALLNAGVEIIGAWELAATASGSPFLRRTVSSWRRDIEAGVTPAEAMRRSRAFPSLFVDQYATGEVTGSLDEVLRRLNSIYQDEGRRKLHAFAQWVPRLIYVGVMLMIAVWVVKFYANYFQQIGKAGGF